MERVDSGKMSKLDSGRKAGLRTRALDSKSAAAAAGGGQGQFRVVNSLQIAGHLRFFFILFFIFYFLFFIFYFLFFIFYFLFFFYFIFCYFLFIYFIIIIVVGHIYFVREFMVLIL